jgi:hypothetical protein
MAALTVIAEWTTTVSTARVALPSVEVTVVTDPELIADAPPIVIAMRIVYAFRAVSCVRGCTDWGLCEVTLQVADPIPLATVSTNPPAPADTLPARVTICVCHTVDAVCIRGPAVAPAAPTIAPTNPNRAVISAPVCSTDTGAARPTSISHTVRATVGVIRTSTAGTACVTTPTPLRTRRSRPVLITHTVPCVSVPMRVRDAVHTVPTSSWTPVQTCGVAQPRVGSAVWCVPVGITGAAAVQSSPSIWNTADAVILANSMTADAQVMTDAYPLTTGVATVVRYTFAVLRRWVALGVSNTALALVLAWSKASHAGRIAGPNVIRTARPIPVAIADTGAAIISMGKWNALHTVGRAWSSTAITQAMASTVVYAAVRSASPGRLTLTGAVWPGALSMIHTAVALIRAGSEARATS